MVAEGEFNRMSKMIQETKPLVTIVTITFNLIKEGREVFFRQCLESVHNQTYANIEHIVVDGASKDGTVDLIKEYADKGWIRYVSQPDSGIYDAMNTGIELANGKYVAFLNSDDYYHNVYGVEASIDALEKSGADFSYACAKIVNVDGISLDYKHPQSHPKISNVFFEMPFCHQTMFTKKSVMIKAGLFNADFKSAGDYDFVIRLCLDKYKSIFITDELITYRLGGLSDVNRLQSLKESAFLYKKNYNKLCSLTDKECRKIYGRAYDGLPLKLANKLRDFEQYFNYDEYIEQSKLKNKLKRKLKAKYQELFAGFKFMFFSPRKFMYKYLNMALSGKLRQPVRKIYYAVRRKKLNHRK